MDHNSLINRKTLEVTMHAEDNLDYFVCDKRISTAIALLNKKGYETLASCGGHYDGGCSEQRNVDISFLNEAKKDKHIFIKEIRDKDFDIYVENDVSHMYVLFKENYGFKTLPEKFTLEIDEENKNCAIYLEVNYFLADNHKKTWAEVERELDKYAKILEDWAENLPDKKGND